MAPLQRAQDPRNATHPSWVGDDPSRLASVTSGGSTPRALDPPKRQHARCENPLYVFKAVLGRQTAGQRMEQGRVSLSAQPPLTARGRSAMSEMRPVTDNEARNAAERLRQMKAAEDATDVAGIAAGYELGVRWACEIAAYAELKSYVEDDASKTPSWISTEMQNQSLPNSAWAGTRMGAKAVWERVAGELEEQGPQ